MKKRLLLAILFLFITTSLFADPGLPCGGVLDPDDVPTGQCPLDTWVLVLAAGAMIPTCLYLSRKQKAAIKAA